MLFNCGERLAKGVDDFDIEHDPAVLQIPCVKGGSVRARRALVARRGYRAPRPACATGRSGAALIWINGCALPGRLSRFRNRLMNELVP